MTHFRKHLLRGLLLNVACLPAAVLAQTAPADTTAPNTTGGNGGVEEIIVSAQRRDTRLQDTPISISALTAKGLEAQGIRNIIDLSAAVPNLTSTGGPQSSSDANFFIRGVGQFDFIATNDPGVGIYVDGVYLGRSVGAMLDSGDIARIEVLRGPQGTLFGRNTLGGAISVTSKMPSLGTFDASARATVGSRNHVDADGSVDVPLGSIAALRIYGFTRHQDGYATNAVNGEKYGNTRDWGTKASLLIKPNTDLTVTLTADYSLDRSDPAPSINEAIAPAPFFAPGAALDHSSNFYTVFESSAPYARNRTYGFSGTVVYGAGPVTLKSITAYRNLTGFSQSDPDGTSYTLYDQDVFTRQNQFSQELQAYGKALDGRLNYLFGAYYFHEHVLQTLDLCYAPITSTQLTPGAACNFWVQQSEQTTDSYAVFSQASYNLTDQFSVTLGGRYTWDNKSIISTQAYDTRPLGFSGFATAGFLGPLNNNGTVYAPGDKVFDAFVDHVPDHLKSQKFSPKIGIDYKAGSNLLIYASYEKGYRSGGFNGRILPSGRPVTSIATYAPDTNDAFELGIKAQPSRALRFSLDGFYNKYKNIQQTIADPAVGGFRVANAGDAELYGFEAEGVAVPVPGLTFNAGVGYTHSKLQNVPTLIGGSVNGNQLPFSPRWTLAAGGEYEIGLGQVGTITPRVDYKFQSKIYFTVYNLPLEQQNDYGLWSARITWNDPSKRYSISAYGLNLSQSHYFTFGQNALASQGVAYAYLGRPREFGVTGGVKF